MRTTYKWQRFLSGLSLPLEHLRLVWTGGVKTAQCIALIGLLTLLTGCGLLPTGGTLVVPNTQVGQQTSQTIGTSTVTKQGQIRTEQVNTQKIDQSVSPASVKSDSVETINVNEWNPWLLLFALAGWILPTPSQIGQAIFDFVSWPFRRNKRK